MIRKKLNNDVEIVDKLSFTPSDFCVIGYCPEFSEDCDYSIDGITEEIKSYFKENFDVPKYKNMIDSAYTKLVNNYTTEIWYEKYIVPLALSGKQNGKK